MDKSRDKEELAEAGSKEREIVSVVSVESCLVIGVAKQEENRAVFNFVFRRNLHMEGISFKFCSQNPKSDFSMVKSPSNLSLIHI